MEEERELVGFLDLPFLTASQCGYMRDKITETLSQSRKLDKESIKTLLLLTVRGLRMGMWGMDMPVTPANPEGFFCRRRQTEPHSVWE
jgi:hypothetical protein